MRRTRTLPLVLLAVAVAAAGAAAQTRSKPQRSKAPLVRTQPVEMTCPSPLGNGVRTGRLFCDVLTGRDPAAGILLKLPKRTGPATLMFELHNRHTYSAEQERSGRSYTRYTATIGVLTLDNTLLARGVVQSDFRREADLFDRVAGDAGSAVMKAVAPTGTETIELEIPPEIEAVSILGEKLTTSRLDGTANYTSLGRPIAIISQPMIEFRPAPPPKKPPARRRG